MFIRSGAAPLLRSRRKAEAIDTSLDVWSLLSVPDFPSLTTY